MPSARQRLPTPASATILRAAEQLLKNATRTRKAFVDAPAAERQADAQLNSARQGLSLMKVGFRKEDTDAARAQLANSEAAVLVSQRQFADADLKAPTTGAILSRVREAGTIVTEFSSSERSGAEVAPQSTIVDRSWYNANREYHNAMVPILIATPPMTMVLMIVGMSVAREQELGTFEQLLVSPLQPIEIVIGKAVPGLIIGLAQCVVMTLIVTLGFGSKITGSLPVLFLGLTIFLIADIGVALFISSLVVNQQQAMMGIMVCMMPAMMLSGFSSPVQNMPAWLQPVAGIDPLTHMLVIVRGVVLRGKPFRLVAERIWPMAAIAVVKITAAALMFRRKVQ